MTLTIDRVQRTDSWRRKFIAAAGARCHYCNRPGSLDEGPGNRAWHIDHMNPLARGGEDVEENLALACKRCNLSKGVQPYKRFKEFARLAWWQEDDRVSEGALDAIMDSWSSVFSRHDDKIGRSRDATTGASQIVSYGSDGDYPESGSPVLISAWTNRESANWATEGHTPEQAERFGRSMDQDDVDPMIDFILSAHNIIPDLVAEIRELRAEAEREDHAA